MPDKLLIVDDDAVNRKLLTVIMKEEGYDIVEAVDGAEAVEKSLCEIPDIILLDIMMPNMDGYEACTKIKSNAKTADIPIIFLSAKTDTKDKIKGLNLGGADFVTKPFDRSEVLARVRAQLKIRHLTGDLLKINEDLLRKQKRLDEDLKAAAEIQKSLLPKESLSIDMLDMAWRFMPCEKIGGDIFNIFRLNEDHIAVYLLDVSGHGVPSALITASVSQILQPQTGYILKKSIHPPPYYEIVPPADVLNALDKEFPIDRFGKYFTISYLLLNHRDGLIRYSNAAHPPPVLLRNSGPIELLKEGGTIIGMGGILPFEEGKKEIGTGDKLFIYSDGIIEYQNEEGTLYGDGRFFNELKNLRDEPVSVIVDGVIASMMDFGNNTQPQDDVSLLALEFTR